MDRIYIDRFIFVFWIGILSLFMTGHHGLYQVVDRNKDSNLVNSRIQLRAVPTVT